MGLVAVNLGQSQLNNKMRTKQAPEFFTPI